MFGENALTGTMLDLVTAVYTRSVPALRAAIEASKSAPRYVLLPPTTRTVPLSPFLEDGQCGATRSFTSLEDIILFLAICIIAVNTAYPINVIVKLLVWSHF